MVIYNQHVFEVKITENVQVLDDELSSTVNDSLALFSVEPVLDELSFWVEVVKDGLGVPIVPSSPCHNFIVLVGDA